MNLDNPKPMDVLRFWSDSFLSMVVCFGLHDRGFSWSLSIAIAGAMMSALSKLERIASKGRTS